MAGFLSHGAVSPEERDAHNQKNRLIVVVSVLVVFTLYLYLFTRFYQVVGISSPQEIAEAMGLAQYLEFESGKYFSCLLQVTYMSALDGDEERLILFPWLLISFVCVYLSPTSHKHIRIVICCVLGMFIFYEPSLVVLLLGLHLATYLCFHPQNKNRQVISFLAALLTVIGFGVQFLAKSGDRDEIVSLAKLAPLGVFVGIIFASLIDKVSPYLASKKADFIRFVVGRGVFFAALAGAALHAAFDWRWKVPWGLTFFFIQWMRLYAYATDYRDGAVPRDLSPWTYLSIFFTPAGLANWGWGRNLCHGYSYVSGCDLRRDKNEIAAKAIRLLLLSVFYLTIGVRLMPALRDYLNSNGSLVYLSFKDLLRNHIHSLDVSANTIQLTSMVHLIHSTIKIAGIYHFLVGVWCLLGYDVDPHVNKPYMATNLVALWSRIMFHYREFLVRGFFYPTFLRMKRQPRWLRILCATVVTVGVANLLTHILLEMVSGDMNSLDLSTALRRWPYFILLTLGIGVTELWLMFRRRKRRPWSLGWRVGLDILAVFFTFQYFALINVFFYRSDVQGSLREYGVIFFRGLGF